MRLIFFVAAIAVTSAASRLAAEELGNAQRGLAYAQANCAGCHAILRDDTNSPNPDSPAFKAVADTPGMTRTALSVFFRSPHPTMPNLIIAPEDADDLIAYIMSLKGDAAPTPN